MPRRPDVSSRAGIRTFDPSPATAVNEAPAPPPAPLPSPEPERFEERFVRRTVYLRRDQLEQLEARRRQDRRRTLAAQLEEAVTEYLRTHR